VKGISGDDIVSGINSLTKRIKPPGQRHPGEMHPGGYSYLGLRTKLDLRLNPDGTPKPDSLSITKVDKAVLRHDIPYSKFKGTPTRNKSDMVILEELSKIKNPTLKERAARAIASPILASKAKLGLGLKNHWIDRSADERHKPIIGKYKKIIVWC